MYRHDLSLLLEEPINISFTALLSACNETVLFLAWELTMHFVS